MTPRFPQRREYLQKSASPGDYHAGYGDMASMVMMVIVVGMLGMMGMVGMVGMVGMAGMYLRPDLTFKHKPLLNPLLL